MIKCALQYGDTLQIELVFERGKPEYPEKTSRSKEEKQQQTQSAYMYDVESGNLTRARMVRGEALTTASSLLPEYRKTCAQNVSGNMR